MTFQWRDLLFVLIIAIYSLAGTRVTVGLPLDTPDHLIDAACLAIYSGIGGFFAYRANPHASLADLFKKP